MASSLRSRDTSIVDRLLAARQAGARLRAGEQSQPGSEEFEERPATTMTSSQRADLVSELMKLRKQQQASQGTPAAHETSPDGLRHKPSLNTPPHSMTPRQPGELLSPTSSASNSARQNSFTPVSAQRAPQRPSSHAPSPPGNRRTIHHTQSPQHHPASSISRVPQPPSQPCPTQCGPHHSGQSPRAADRLANVAGAPDCSVFRTASRSRDSLQVAGVPQPQPSVSPRRPTQARLDPEIGDMRPRIDSLLMQESSCMVLRGECSEQPPYASPTRAPSTCPTSPPHAWEAPPTPACAPLPRQSPGSSAPASAVVDDAARTHFQIAREESHIVMRAREDGPPEALQRAAAEASAGREVSFGHESVATTGTQSIFFAEDLLREQGSGGGGLGTSDGSQPRAPCADDGTPRMGDCMGTWERREGGIGYDGYGQSGGGELSWDSSKFDAGAPSRPLDAPSARYRRANLVSASGKRRASGNVSRGADILETHVTCGMLKAVPHNAMSGCRPWACASHPCWWLIFAAPGGVEISSFRLVHVILRLGRCRPFTMSVQISQIRSVVVQWFVVMAGSSMRSSLCGHNASDSCGCLLRTVFAKLACHRRNHVLLFEHVPQRLWNSGCQHGHAPVDEVTPARPTRMLRCQCADSVMGRQQQQRSETQLPQPPRTESEVSDGSERGTHGHGWVPLRRQKSASLSGGLPGAGRAAGGGVPRTHAAQASDRHRPRPGSPQLRRSRQELLDTVMRERVRDAAAGRPVDLHRHWSIHPVWMQCVYAGLDKSCWWARKCHRKCWMCRRSGQQRSGSRGRRGLARGAITTASRSWRSLGSLSGTRSGMRRRSSRSCRSALSPPRSVPVRSSCAGHPTAATSRCHVRSLSMWAAAVAGADHGQAQPHAPLRAAGIAPAVGLVFVHCFLICV